MQPIEFERGYLVIAQNNDTIDYIKCARMLARSLRRHQPDAKICLLTDNMVDEPDFDIIKLFPFGDRSDGQWKLHNDWQCFYASPFRCTLKIEADMLVPGDISHWFDVLQHREIVVTVGARTYHNKLGRSRYYRRIFDANDLPDAYNAITYWRRTGQAEQFFSMVKMIMADWKNVMSVLKYGNEQPINTDLAYAIAMKTLGTQNFISMCDIPSLIHMKPRFNNLQGDDWTQELIWEFTDSAFRINTVAQCWPVHYHEKHFVYELERQYQ